jgi:NAD(P)-dependent dehydrogenase (short-subunit alcohol dehydrogenase family)
MSPRTWLITGCSTGLGRALATYLLAAGESVAVGSRNAAHVADIVEASPGRAIALALDVADPAAPAAAVAQAEKLLGRIDVLVNNAGYGYVATIEEGDEAAIKAMFEVNFFGALRMIRAVLPSMRFHGRGRIIQISSLTGRITNPATGLYSASKHALEAISGALARELAGSGVKVTSIAPGMFPTDFNGRSMRVGNRDIEAYKETAHARVDLIRSVDMRIGDPQKFAAAVKNLAEMEDPPQQLLLGSDAYGATTNRMREQLASIEACKAISMSTDTA